MPACAVQCTAHRHVGNRTLAGTRDRGILDHGRISDEPDHEAAGEARHPGRMQNAERIIDLLQERQLTELVEREPRYDAAHDADRERTEAVYVTGARRDADEARDHTIDHRDRIRLADRPHVE